MSLKIIGVMSGTSCDGLDLCLVSFDCKEQKYDYKIHKAVMVDYPLDFQKKLKEASLPDDDRHIYESALSAITHALSPAVNSTKEDPLKYPNYDGITPKQ